MSERRDVERLLESLYTARIAANLDGVCASFTDDAKLEIAGASYASPMTVKATGSREIRNWMALLVKTFQLSDRQTVSTIIEGNLAAVQWRARVRSRITGAAVLTEFIDIVQVREGRIASYTEFFVPR